MASSTTSNVYIHVIEDVINKVREEFTTNGGPGDSVLSELQGIWEMKMMQAGAILGPIDRTSAAKPGAGGPTPVHDLNVPYEGTEEYETPTADMLFPPTPLQTPMPTPMPGMAQTPLPGTAQTPLPGTAHTPMTGTSDSSLYNIPTGTPITPNEYSSANDIGGLQDVKPVPGRPSPYMQPPQTWANQRPRLDVNVAYVGEEGDRGGSHQPTTQDFFLMSAAGKRKRDEFPPQYPNGGYIPQQDGASGSISNELKVGLGSSTLSNNAAKAGMSHQGGRFFSNASQVDGPAADPYDDELSTPNIYNYQGGSNDDYHINTPATNEIQQAATPAAPVQNDNVEEDDDDEPLNEDDDDEYDDVDQGDDLNTSHLVLAQFDKVTRTKSRWKCNLKDGIMHINNKDILFNKATGEFDF